MNVLKRFFLLCASVVLLVLAANAAIWYESYGKAKDAIRAEKWNEAIKLLDQSIELKPGSDDRARTYGVNYDAYFPYLMLGIAYYHLGQLDAAAQALDTEEKFEAIKRSDSYLAQLRQYRALVSKAKEERAATEQEKVQNIVAKSLEQAGLLEAKQELDAAIAEVGKALAVAPNDQNAKNALIRLQAKVVLLAKQREQEFRAGTLANEGESYLAAGQFEAASGKFAESLSIVRSDRVQQLLNDAQEKLRLSQVGPSAEPSSKARTVLDILMNSKKLESHGELAKALTGLQAALAIDPNNRQLLDFQQSLLAKISKASDDRSRDSRLQTLLSDSQRFFMEGDFVESLASANQALALDPENGEAKDYMAKAYHALSQSLLGKQTLSPMISWINKQDYEFGQGYSAQKVRLSDYSLSGSVFHETPIQITIKLDHYRSPNHLIRESQIGEGSQKEKQRILKPALNEVKIGEEFITIFEVAPDLTAGLSAFSITATEPAKGRTKVSRYLVYYAPPLYRTAWFYIGVFGIVLTAAITAHGLRRRRRALALKRRFNPFVAGAPVLQDDLFFGREELLQRILQTIHNNSIMLFGERRIGKTSLQHHLKKRLCQLDDPDYAFYAVFIDLQGVPQERFFFTLREEISHELGPLVEECKSLPPPVNAADYDYRALVNDLMKILKILSAQTSKKVRLVLLIDEVDQLNAYDPKVNQRLRSLFMRNFAEKIVAVVSGVSIRKNWDGEGSPWYNFFEEIEVKPFLEKDAEMLIERPIRGIIKLEKGVTSRIISATHCRPYLIQKLCVGLVNKMYEEGRRTITLADVETLVSRTEI